MNLNESNSTLWLWFHISHRNGLLSFLLILMYILLSQSVFFSLAFDSKWKLHPSLPLLSLCPALFFELFHTSSENWECYEASTTGLENLQIIVEKTLCQCLARNTTNNICLVSLVFWWKPFNNSTLTSSYFTKNCFDVVFLLSSFFYFIVYIFVTN